MDVRRVEAAGAEEAEGHGGGGADEGGEAFAVGFDGVAAVAGGDACRCGVEVEDEVGVGEEGYAVDGVGGEDQGGD